MNNQIDFLIAGLKLRLNMPHPISITKGFKPFGSNFENPDITVRIHSRTWGLKTYYLVENV